MQNPIIVIYWWYRIAFPSKNLCSYSSKKFTTLHRIPRDLFVEEIIAYSAYATEKKYLQTQEISPAGFRRFYWVPWLNTGKPVFSPVVITRASFLYYTQYFFKISPEHTALLDAAICINGIFRTFSLLLFFLTICKVLSNVWLTSCLAQTKYIEQSFKIIV